MLCIDTRRPRRRSGRYLHGTLLWLLLLAGCSTPVSLTQPPVTPAPVIVPTPEEAAEQAADEAAARRAAAAALAAAPVVLPPPGPVRNWAELRLQAAHRLMAANPRGTYDGEVPEPLLAIPVLEIELNADGSVRRIGSLRVPSQATDTVALAAEAVKRAAPFGDVSRLPKPWRFTETFLFNDDRKFKPRTLDP